MSNDSQRLIPCMSISRSSVEVQPAFIQACRSELEALNLCMNLSGLSDETIRDALGIDKAQFSRWQSGTEGIQWSKFTALMDKCGNRAPVQYEAMRLNCEVVDLSKDAQIRALEQQLATLRRAA